MHLIFQYFQHLLKSTNQHGVHSPFVFDLLTKCLYQKQKLHSSKYLDILIKSMTYFKMDAISMDEKLIAVKKAFKQQDALQFNENKPFDLIYLEHTEDLRTISTNAVHNDSMVFIHQIHKNKEATQEWNLICKQKEYTVSIDLFYCGLLFFRKEQEKEHFIIRI